MPNQLPVPPLPDHGSFQFESGCFPSRSSTVMTLEYLLSPCGDFLARAFPPWLPHPMFCLNYFLAFVCQNFPKGTGRREHLVKWLTCKHKDCQAWEGKARWMVPNIWHWKLVFLPPHTMHAHTLASAPSYTWTYMCTNTFSFWERMQWRYSFSSLAGLKITSLILTINWKFD